jgi:hypothetical protein
MTIRDVTLHFDDAGVIEPFGVEVIQAACDNFETLFNMGLIQFSLDQNVDHDDLFGDERVVKRIVVRDVWTVDARPRSPNENGPQVAICPDGMEPIIIPQR